MVMMFDRLKCRLLNGWNRVFLHGPSLDFPSYCEEHGFCFDKEFYKTELQHRACSYLFKFGAKKRVDCIIVFMVPEKNIYRHCSA